MKKKSKIKLTDSEKKFIGKMVRSSIGAYQKIAVHICGDCKFHRASAVGINYCERLEPTSKISLVTGKKEVFREIYYCESERSIDDEGSCGHKAKYWEPRT